MYSNSPWSEGWWSHSRFIAQARMISSLLPTLLRKLESWTSGWPHCWISWCFYETSAWTWLLFHLSCVSNLLGREAMFFELFSSWKILIFPHQDWKSVPWLLLVSLKRHPKKYYIPSLPDSTETLNASTEKSSSEMQTLKSQYLFFSDVWLLSAIHTVV